MCDVPKTLESTSAPASSETGTYRLHLGHRDPGSTLLIHAEPLQDTRAPRSARDARRALQCASPAFAPERGFSQQPLQLRFSLSTAVPLAKNVSSGSKTHFHLWNAFSTASSKGAAVKRETPRFGRGVGAKLGETNERARFVEGRQAGPRGAHEARAARTRPPVLFVSITGTFSGSSGERYVPSLPMRPIEPPIPVRRLPSLPRCASGEIDPVSCSRSRRDRVADPAGRAPRRAAHVTLVWRQDRFPPAKDALRDPLTSSPPRAFPATSRTT